MDAHPTLSSQWYRDAFKLDMKDMGWTQHTVHEVEFLATVVPMDRPLRILDLGCGFGRHAIELGLRGHTVVGVDINPELTAYAREWARDTGLTRVQFLTADIREIDFEAEFDLVLNMYDGGIGYLENDEENLRAGPRTGDRGAQAGRPSLLESGERWLCANALPDEDLGLW